MSNEDINCPANKRRLGYEISYDWVISLMYFLMTEVNSKYWFKKKQRNNVMKKLQFEKTSKQNKRNKPSWMTYDDCYFFNHPNSPPFSKVFFTSVFNMLSPHMMYHMFEREYMSTGSHTLLCLVAKVSLSFTKIWMSSFITRLQKSLYRYYSPTIHFVY